MPVSGSGSADAAAAAAARAAQIAAERRAEQEAQRRAQEAAERKAQQAAAQRQAAEAAQKKAQQAAQKNIQAQAQAKQAAAAKQRAQAELAGKNQQVSQHPQLAAKLKPEIDAAQKKVDAAESANRSAQAKAEAAAQKARELAQKANESATRAIQAEQGANEAYKAAGKPPPFAAANRVNDAYSATQLSSADQKKLFGGNLAVSNAAKADAARLGQVQNPAARAQMLQSMVKNATDPTYQKALVDAAGPQIKSMASQIVSKDSGISVTDRQAALDALSQTTEKVRPDAQKSLASAFASAMKNENVGDDGDEFGTLLKNGIESGSGASFGVRLASELQSSGKTTAANDASKFIGQGIGELKQSFEDAKEKVDDLNAKMGQELATWRLEGRDQTNAVKTFDERNGVAAAQADLEKQGRLLASVLPGADLAANDPALKAGAAATQPIGIGGGQVSKFSNESDLLDAAKGTMHDLPELADTKAGAEALSSAVEAEGEGEETFLSRAAEYAEQGESAKKFVDNVRAATVQAVGVKLLDAARTGDFEGESQKLLSGLNASSKLFGATPEQMQGLTRAYGAFKPGMTAAQLESASQNLGNQIRTVSSDAEGAVAQSLKGLGVVFGAVGAVSDWSHFSEASVKEKLGTIAGTLNVGKEGAELVTTTLTRFTADSATAGSGEAVAETAGLTAGKLLGAGIGALGTVVSGWNAVDDFSSGNIQAGVGDSLSALGGAVTTAGLFLDGTIVGAEAGVVLNVAGGVIAAAGAVVSLFSSPPDPFESQEGDLKAELQSIGVKEELADQLNSFNDDGQNTFGAWISQVAKQAKVPTGTLVRSMNNWSDDQVAQFLDAGRLQQGTDSNNGNRLENARAVLGSNADALEDPSGDVRLAAQWGNTEAQSQLDAELATQRDLREQPNKSGAYVYDAALVQQTVSWLRQNGLVR